MIRLWGAVIALAMGSSAWAQQDEGLLGRVRAASDEKDDEIQRLRARLAQLEAERGPDEEFKSLLVAEEDENQKELGSLRERIEALEASAPAAQDDTTFKVYWKSGLRLDTADKAFRFRIGGRIQNDFFWISENRDLRRNFGVQEDGVEFRRARLYMQGDLYNSVFFKAQYDFAGQDADFKDVYAGIKGLPYVGNLRVGHFKEPMGLEIITSSKYVSFLERALPNLFLPERNTGAMIHNTLFDGRATWAVGGFRDVGDSGDDNNNGGGALSGRVTGLPVWNNDGEQLVHLGVSARVADPTDDVDDSVVGVDGVAFGDEPEVHEADDLIGTGAIPAENLVTMGVEGAAVWGPFSVQAEYMRVDVEVSRNAPPTMSDVSFDGWYVFGSWFVTGERRIYKQSSASFDRVKPSKNFMGEEGGFGAVELLLRYSMVDLEDDAIYGGEESNVTVGATWYLNPNTKIMVNGVMADVESDDPTLASSDLGELTAFMVRFHIDF